MRSKTFWLCASTLVVSFGAATARERPPETAKAVVQTGQEGCAVEFDADAAGSTDTSGKLAITAIDPGDHYVHVQCPGRPELTYFVSPKPNEELQITPQPAAAATDADPLVMAQNKAQLERLVQQALQLRAAARLDEAVAALRQAAKLDTKNADLHRELGITFLLGKEWKRARVEMIEAIRNDQGDADAHNGLGYALEKLGNMDGALKEYRTASQLEPDDATYRTHYLDALVKLQARQQSPKK